MNSVTCPDDVALDRYAGGLLEPTLRQQIADHLVLCARCRDIVSRGAQRDANPTGASASIGASATTRMQPGSTDSPVTERELIAETCALAAERSEEGDLDLNFLNPSPNRNALGLIGKYEVSRVLGRGGMGIVFQAFDDALHRTVAVKVMAPELASSVKARRRFVREARAAAAINHPNVVIIHAVDEQNGMPYLVMEYVAGCSLRHRLRRPPRLEPVDMVRIGLQIAAGLAAAHEQGVIHRDIKPSNVLLEESIDRVKIADFGLARAAMDLTDITTLGHGVGTPAYVSPEQVTGGAVDQRCDLFSLGCVIYAMSVGHSPFRGRSALEVIRRVADHNPPPLVECDPRVPQSLSDVVDKLLQKEPPNRYQSAREVVTALTEQLALFNQMPSERLPRVAAVVAPPERPKVGRIVAGVAVIVVLAATAWLATRPPRQVDNTGKDIAAGKESVPAAPPRENAVVTVGPSGEADFSTLTEALANVGPKSTVRILDGSSYDAPIVINDTERLRGLRIEAPQHAVLQNSSSNAPVVSISGTPDVVLDGLQLLAKPEQHALLITGEVPGVRIENVVCKHPSDAGRATAVIDGAVGTPAAPVVLRNCAFEINGVTLLSRDKSPVRCLTIDSCRFRLLGSGVAVILDTMVSQIDIERNVFTGGGGGWGVHIGPESSEVQVRNNTFFEMFDWVAVDSHAITQNISVRRNLVLQSQRLLHENSAMADVVKLCLSDNYWELSSAADETEVRAVCAPREPMSRLPVVSRDPASSDFLRPEPGSLLAGSDDGDVIGALPPGDVGADAE